MKNKNFSEWYIAAQCILGRKITNNGSTETISYFKRQYEFIDYYIDRWINEYENQS